VPVLGAGGWWLYDSLAADVAPTPLTQNQRSGAQLSWRGNRLAGVYSHLTAGWVGDIGQGRSPYVSALVQRHGQLPGEGRGLAFWLQPQNLGLGGCSTARLNIAQLGMAGVEASNWGVGRGAPLWHRGNPSLAFLGFAAGRG
jgi:hypothetical protein